jgi:HEAT repeat protein
MADLSAGMGTGSLYDPDDVAERKLGNAIAALASLEGGEEGVIAVLGFGAAAIAPLGSLLFQRERSGIYQPRCRAAKALGFLGAYNVLREFLTLRREIEDPVERTGEDAAINAAARALAGARDEPDFELLLAVLRWRILPGVIEAAGAFNRPEAIPLFIGGLAEDDCCLAAAEALRRLGRTAEQALIRCAAAVPVAPELESETSRRQRRRALHLLVEMEISPGAWDGLQHLMNDPDVKIAVLACKLALSTPEAAGKDAAAARLYKLLEHCDWVIAEEIEGFLTNYDREAGSGVRTAASRDTGGHQS